MASNKKIQEAKVIDQEVLDENSPEEQIRAWLDWFKNQDHEGDWASPLVAHVEFESVTVNPDKATSVITYSYTVQPSHCNRLGQLHGGAAASLFDSLTSIGLVLISKPGFWQRLGVSRTLNVTYFRPVPMGSKVLIETEVLQAGRTMCTLRGTMKRPDGTLLCVCEHGKANIDKAVATSKM